MILNIQNLVIGIMILSYLIPFVFIRTRKRKAINKVMKESREFGNISDFIEMEKEKFKSYERFTFFLIGIFIAIYVAKGVTSVILNVNIIGPIIYVISIIGFIGSLSTYFHLRPLQLRIIEELYKNKINLKNSH